ncbi:MAG TPA: GNAT family N-acetyltransferase [Myxococcales bacterium]|jgi:predicted GNAT family N-acyltransferase
MTSPGSGDVGPVRTAARAAEAAKGPVIEVRAARTQEAIETCLRLRWTVYVEEQGVRPSEEVDEHDRTDAVHALALMDGVPCGTGRFIFEEPGRAKIQRMAVVDDVRGQGIGRALLHFLEAEARKRGARSFTLGAQVQARPFYEKAGYAAVGDVFDDARIPHIRMDKQA